MKPIDSTHGELFRAAQQAYQGSPDYDGWVTFELKDANEIEVLDSRSVRLDEAEKRVFVVGNRLCINIERYEVVRLKLRLY